MKENIKSSKQGLRNDMDLEPNESQPCLESEMPPKSVKGVSSEQTPLQFKASKWRNLIAYWILGLCNNYGYVVMLTAANDILHEQTASESSDIKNKIGNNTVITTFDSTLDRECNYISTGAILLADIVPSLTIKLLAPFLPFVVDLRIIICVVFGSLGFLLVAFSTSASMSIGGVIITSFCSGLGEVTYLQYSSFYDKNVVSTWSSGTGGAGVVGALSYTLLKKLGLRNALLIMLIVPLIMAVSFWLILTKPIQNENNALEVQRAINNEELRDPIVALKKKFNMIPSLMKYMIPLGLVYLFEYFINQGMFELIKFDDIFIDHDEQYRWLQVDYQIGVFLSRSSVNIFHIKQIWLMSALQLINVALFTTEAIFYYIPSFYIVLALTLWEGLLGGAAYVNTFYKISSEVSEEDKQFSMATTSFADTIGITFAGIFAILAHNKICELPKYERLSF